MGKQNMSVLDPVQAARLFITTRGRGGPNEAEDTLALAQLIQEFAEAAYNRAKQVNEGETLDICLREVTQHYKDHKIAPGFQVAYLKDKDQYYAAIHIFPNGVNSRTVYAKGIDVQLSVALGKCMAAWRKRIKDEGT